MASRFSSAREFLERKALQAQERNSLDSQVKRAQLAQSGFGVQESKPMLGIFGGGQMSLTQDSNAASLPEGFVRVNGKIEKDPAFISPTDQALIDYRKAKIGQGGNLTAGQRGAKDKATTEIFGTVEANKVKRNTLDNAMEGADRVPAGFLGKAKLGAMRFFGSKDPVLADAQELKMALTDATLANTAHTKGAISDAEMMLFKEASANNDFNNPGVVPVLKKLRAFLDADEAGKFGAYQKNYGEDPRTWFGSQNNEMPSFNSIEEAERSGHKGPALIGGREAVIE